VDTEGSMAWAREQMDTEVIDLRDPPPAARSTDGPATILPTAGASARRHSRDWSPWVRVAAASVVLAVVLAVVVALLVEVRDLRSEVGDLRRADAVRLNALAQQAAVSRQDAASAGASAASLGGRLDALAAQVTSAPDISSMAARSLGSVLVVVTPTTQGTAWVAASGGGRSTLVTAYHVVADTWTSGGRSVQVQQQGVSLTATLVTVDTTDDLAALTVAEALPVLVRSTAKPAVGAPIVVIGNPLGLEGTVTSGIVSALRSLDKRDYVQFSAASNPGSSGGPVLDQRGAVIGVDDSGYGPKDDAYGLSFAVPVAHVCTGLGVC